KCFKGLNLEDRLSTAEKKAKCGLIVVDLRSGEIVHWFNLEGDLTELFDVAILPGIRQPTALGFKNDELARTINIPSFRGVLGSRQDEKSESESAHQISPFLPKPRSLSNLKEESEEKISAPEIKPSLPNPFLRQPSYFPRLEALKIKNIDFGFNPIQANSEPSIPSTQNAQDLFRQGKAAVKQGQLETAAECFQNALELHPNYLAVYNQLGQVLQTLGQTEKAIAVFQDALRIDPNLAPLHCNLGSIWQLQGKIDLALDAYTKAIKFHPNLGMAYLNRGRLLAQQQQYSLATKDFQQLIQLQPQSAEVYYHYGNALGQQRKVDKAIATLYRAIALQPDYAEAHNSLGYCYQQQGAIELARQYYLQARKIQPDLPEVLLKEVL
ncbi:MAG: tetratricopeptide repeat protein, partial [Pleurocapsa sp.]